MLGLIDRLQLLGPDRRAAAACWVALLGAAALALPVFVFQGERAHAVTLEDFGRWQQALDGRPCAWLATYPH